MILRKKKSLSAYFLTLAMVSNLIPLTARAETSSNLDFGSISRVSVDATGAQSNGASDSESLSRDGRFVVFASSASNLVPGDTNGKLDIFRKDLQNKEVVRVSVDSSGGQANDSSSAPSISSDGRYVTFESTASNLVSGDTNGVKDVFRKDLQTGDIIRVSLNQAGGQANGTCSYSSISGDGCYVTFISSASNLVSDDTNGQPDVFRKDCATGAVLRVSADSTGGQVSGGEFSLALGD